MTTKISQAQETPLVSVIIPAYHSEKTIEKAIDSALLQEVPLEILVLNDSPKDQLSVVLKKYNDDSRIRYFENEPHLGASGSRNKGVQLARGNYIAFLDSDDWWEPEKLKKQLSLMKKTGAVLCSTARRLVGDSTRLSGKIIPTKENITYSMMLHQNWINCSSVLVRRDVISRFPMTHEDSHEDYITWLKILKEYRFACAVNEPLLNYTVSNFGKSGSKFKSAKMTFLVYRYMGFGLLKSIFYFGCYAVNGLKKYS